MPLELAHRLHNAAYYYHEALEHITKTFIPSIVVAVNSGETRLVGNQLDTLSNYIEQFTENYSGLSASSDYCELDETASYHAANPSRWRHHRFTCHAE